MSDKKYTPQEVALALFKSVKELAEKHRLEKTKKEEEKSKVKKMMPLENNSATTSGSQSIASQINWPGTKKKEVEKCGEIKKAKSDEKLSLKDKKEARDERSFKSSTKGIHSDMGGDKGVSIQGLKVRDAAKFKAKGDEKSAKDTLVSAKTRHKDKLADLKEMKKPSLPKSEVSKCGEMSKLKKYMDKKKVAKCGDMKKEECKDE